MCLLVVCPSINAIFYYDPLILSKLSKININLTCHLNISSWLNININFAYPIVHVENTNPVGIYLKIMSHIEICKNDIYELDHFKIHGIQLIYINFLIRYF